MRRREAAWIRLDGLSLNVDSTHSALCHALTPFGLGAEPGHAVPTLVVLDWSTVTDCSAEGIAFFAVLVRRLSAMGVRVIACQPLGTAVSEVLKCSGVRSVCGPTEWVPCPCEKGFAAESLAPAAIFGPDANDSVDDFCDGLSTAIRRLGVVRRTAAAVMGTTHELLHNVLSHAHAQHAAATALLLPRKRPQVLQIGVADDGIGITGSVLRHERHQWLSWFHDASVTEVVLHQALSGREAAVDGGGGGGLANILQRLLRETPATVLLRSGAAYITLRSTAPDHFEKTALTYGAGTQFRLELRLV